MYRTATGKNKYGMYCVPASSLETSPPAKKIMSGEIYEPDTIQFIIDNCGDGDILHAGTYFGDFLPALAKNCSEGAKVWAFEPKGEHYYCAMKTLKMNDIHNTMLMHCALGKYYGKQKLQTTNDDGVVWGGGTRIVPDTKSKDTEEVFVMTIDEVIPHNRDVSIIHLDVEGYETPALEGGMKTIKDNLPILILETMPTNEWLSKNLYSLGYSITGKLHRNTILKVK